MAIARLTDTKQQTYILGAGAVGHLLACFYYQANKPCHLISRHVNEPTEMPVTFISPEHKHAEMTVAYTGADNINHIKELFLAVKSHQLTEALTSVAHALDADSRIMLLSNGMGNLESAQACLSDNIAPEQLWPGINTHGCYLNQCSNQLQVVHSGTGKITYGHNYLADDNHFGSDFSIPPELNASEVDDIETKLWLKLAINAVINPLTALNKCRNGELMRQPVLYDKVNVLITELAELYSRLNIKLSREDLTQGVEAVIAATANNYSSMQRDIMNKKPSEIEAITGFLLKYAQSMQFLMQEHQYLYQQIKNIERDHNLSNL